MAELAHIEKIQKSADFWGSKLKENINFHFWKNMNSPNDDEEDTWKQIHNLWRMVVMIRGRGIPRKYILELTQIWNIRMMLMKRRKVNPTNASITHEKKNTLSRMVMMIRGRGIPQKYILELTQIQTLQIIMMIKRRKVNPRNVSITIKHKWKIFEGRWWWNSTEI